MLGLCSSVSILSHCRFIDHQPNSEQTILRTGELCHPRAHLILRALPLPNPSGPRPYYFRCDLRYRGSSERERSVVQLERQSSRKQTNHGARSSQSRLDHTARGHHQLYPAGDLFPPQMLQSQTSTAEPEGNPIYVVLQQCPHHGPHYLSYGGIFLNFPDRCHTGVQSDVHLANHSLRVVLLGV